MYSTSCYKPHDSYTHGNSSQLREINKCNHVFSLTGFWGSHPVVLKTGSLLRDFTSFGTQWSYGIKSETDTCKAIILAHYTFSLASHNAFQKTMVILSNYVNMSYELFSILVFVLSFSDSGVVILLLFYSLGGREFVPHLVVECQLSVVFGGHAMLGLNLNGLLIYKACTPLFL